MIRPYRSSVAIARLAALAAILAVLPACAETPQVNLGGNYAVAMSMPPIENPDIDVLFVIDDSPSMLDNQEQLAQGAQTALFDVISSAVHGVPNLHIGVITSSLGAGGFEVEGCTGDGDGGRLQRPVLPGCTAAADSYLVDVATGEGGRVQNFEGSLEDAFGCIVRRQGRGCAFEQPLAALERAISGEVVENAGFLRPQALLVVVFMSDEDDCSSSDGLLYDPDDPDQDPFLPYRCFAQGVVCTPDDPTATGAKQQCRARARAPHVLDVQHTADRLVAAKGGDPALVMVATIAGQVDPVSIRRGSQQQLQLEPVCQDPGGGGEAVPAIRLFELLRKFPGRSWFDTICAPEVGPALRRTGDTVGDVAGRRPCLRGDFRDVEPATFGVQPSCLVYAVAAPFTSQESRVELPACAASDDPAGKACFRVVPDAALCGAEAPALRVDVERAGDALAGKYLVVECLRP